MYIFRLLIVCMTLAFFVGCGDQLETRINPAAGIDLPTGSKLILPPGGDPNPALCCGSCDSNNNCENCAVIGPFTGCQGGTILTCPEGEFITEDGDGGCA